MAFGKKPSSGEMRGKREKSDKPMRGKMMKQSESKPAAKKAAPKKQASPFEGGGSPFPFAGGGAPGMEMGMGQMQRDQAMGMGAGAKGMGGGAGMNPSMPSAAGQIGAALGGGMMGGKGGMMGGAPPARPMNPGMGAGLGQVGAALGGGMMGGGGAGPMNPNGPAVSGVSQLPPGRPMGPMAPDKGMGYGMDRFKGRMAGAQAAGVPGAMPAPGPRGIGPGMVGAQPSMMPPAGAEEAGMTTGYSKGGKVCMAEGGKVGDALRKFVGMPTKKRGDQLERQEQEILNPPADPKKK
jgi:hypothetical protein